MNVAFKAVVGSTNYNLADERSDKDYKVFYFPAFEDIYSGDKTSKHKTSVEEDIEYHDIRKLPDMLWKSNVNFIEVLFSEKVEVSSYLYDDLFIMREEIASMNLPYLWDACYGMIYQNLKSADRDMNYIDIQDEIDVNNRKIGKSLYQADRILYFLQEYANTEFKDFARAIKVTDDNKRNYLLGLKSGRINPNEEYNYLSEQMDSKEMLELKKIYKSQKKKELINDQVINIVKRYVKSNIAYELKEV